MFHYIFLKWVQKNLHFDKVYADTKYGYSKTPNHHGFELNRIFDIHLDTSFLSNLISDMNDLNKENMAISKNSETPNRYLSLSIHKFAPAINIAMNMINRLLFLFRNFDIK